METGTAPSAPDLTGVHVFTVAKRTEVRGNRIVVASVPDVLCGAKGVRGIHRQNARRLPIDERRKLCRECAARLS